MATLALLGGTPLRTTPFSRRATIGAAERKAVLEVLEQGDISLFFGSPGDFFLGGPKIREFEKKWADRYGYKHCISVNSWTTGLMTAVGAAGVGPGDEVICTATSMSATSTAILFYGGIPVFSDIDPVTFCLDPAKIEEKITERTKAIMVVHLFGHPADMDAISDIARRHNLIVIEDAAQAPGAKYKGNYVGAMKDIGGFSLNYHKHVHTGEGGLIVTNSDVLADHCQRIRNHGENVIEAYSVQNLCNSIGANYRLTEIQAAIGLVQMQHVDEYVAHRNLLADYLTSQLEGIECLSVNTCASGDLHSYYIYAFHYNEEITGVSRGRFIEAVCAEFPKPEIWEQTPLAGGYIAPLYWNPIYQKQQAIGTKGFPFSYNSTITYNYNKGLCPVAESMHERKLLFTPLVREAISVEDIADLGRALMKVAKNVSTLR
jgi:perosamine synthetase